MADEEKSTGSGNSHVAGGRQSYNKGRGYRNKNDKFSRGGKSNYFRDRDRGSKSRGDHTFRNDGASRYNDNYNRKPYKRTWSHYQKDGQTKKLREIGDRLKEPDIGVTEFIGDHTGFFGIVKQRYSDFHVNEIALDGQVAKLINQDIPAEKKDEHNVEDLMKHVHQIVLDQLKILKEDSSVDSIEIDVTDLDKTQRQAIHTIAHEIKGVDSQTNERDGKKIMLIFKGNNWRATCQRDNRINWEKQGGEYCHFILHKVNMDTMDALNQIAVKLRLKPNNFLYAGTKDRRAWTTQWISLRRVIPQDILRAARAVRGAYVGNFKYATEPLKLGMLNGNRFRIALRNVDGTDEQIEKAMTSLRDEGFINYYGLQRFGTVAAIPTHEIGKALLQSKWEEAIKLILKPREGEQDRDLAEARRIYAETNDAHAAYERIIRLDKIEATLLKGLCLCGSRNPQGALDSIPRNIRLMYIHAYQSFVWNHMVSRRIKEFGAQPIVGDLVYEDPNDKEQLEIDNFNAIDIDDKVTTKVSSTERDEKNNTQIGENAGSASNVGTLAEDIEEDQEVAENPVGIEKKDTVGTTTSDITDDTQQRLKTDTDVNKTSTDKEDQAVANNLPNVKILTEEDLPNYTLADIIMPQPGWKVTYPPYSKPWFDEFLAKDELTADLKRNNKKYSLGGAYRKILQIPLDLSWSIMHYKEKNDDLIRSDIDQMRNIASPKNDSDGKNKALIVEMSLSSCAYATMALREILKFDTSPQSQAAQFAARNPEDTQQESSDLEKVVADNDTKCLDDINKVDINAKNMDTEIETDEVEKDAEEKTNVEENSKDTEEALAEEEQTEDINVQDKMETNDACDGKEIEEPEKQEDLNMEVAVQAE